MADYQTLYFDTEKSGESYVHLYADEPGIPKDQPLWPAPIPVIGVSGAIGQGKTTFLLDIAGGPVKRFDVPMEMMKLHPRGYRPMDTFMWFLSVVKSIPPRMFRVIALDVAEEMEQGVAEYVWEHPLEFGTTKQQFIKMSGVYQGIVSSYWKSILMDITSRCDTFAFANHIGLVFDSGGKAVAGKTKSKGRPVMKQSASLYINLRREKDNAGNLADRPSGVVDLSEGGKSRLMTKVVRNGIRVRVPVLPPRMPLATPQAIRDYFVNPPDYSNLAGGQRAPERVMTADDRVEAQTELVRQQMELERLKIERIAEERKSANGGGESHAAEAMFDADESPSQPEPQVGGGRSNDAIAEAVMDAAEAALAVSRTKTTEASVLLSSLNEAKKAGAEATATVAPQQITQPEPPAQTEPSATEETKASRVRLPKDAIVNWLANRQNAIRFDDLVTGLHGKYGVDSQKVYTSAKSLKADGKIAYIQIGDTVWVGMPDATFPAGTATNGAVNGTANGAVNGTHHQSMQSSVGETKLGGAASEPASGAAVEQPAPTQPPTPSATTTAPAAPVAPAAQPAAARPANLPRNLLDSVRTLFEEFTQVAKKMSRADADTMWKAGVLTRYGASADKELGDDSLREVERMLISKIEAHYIAIGQPEASPLYRRA